MDDLTSRPWWRWQTGMVVQVEGGVRPVNRAVVVAAAGLWRVVDEWGDLGIIGQPGTGRVAPDLDSPAMVGVLLERVREVAHKTPSLRSAEDLMSTIVSLAKLESEALYRGVPGSPCASACSALIAALDDVTGVAP